LSGIIVGVLVALVGVAIVSVVFGRRLGVKERRQVEEAEMQLMLVQGEHAVTQASMNRMLEAWQIPGAHVTYERQLAEGTYGEVWRGHWGTQLVAIKVGSVSLVGVCGSACCCATATFG
jgi:hypothetical protein